MKFLTATLLATTLAAGPALAQSTSQEQNKDAAAAATQSTHQNQKQRTAAEPSASANENVAAADRSKSETRRSTDASSGGMTTEQMVASQKRVTKVLTEAGLSDVTIMDAAYLVQATTPQDEQVMMIVNSAGQPISAGQTADASSAQQKDSSTN